MIFINYLKNMGRGGLYIATLFFIFIFIFIFFYVTGRKDMCDNCNVVLISIDTLRPDHMGVYGYKNKITPNIDEWAQKSTVFKNFYSTSSWTIPAHASMFTSKFPSSVKTETIFDALPDDSVTISKVLRNNGYTTFGIDADSYVSPKWNFHQGFNEFLIENTDYKNNRDAKFIFSDGGSWIEKNKNSKFFVFLHIFQPHDPYCPEGEFLKEEFSSMEGSCMNKSKLRELNKEKKLNKSLDISSMVNLYDGEIAAVDYYFGNFIKKIDALNLKKNTIIILTSDHGEEFGEHGIWGMHGHTLYNELVKIPLIIHNPKSKSSINLNISSLIDLAPTILDLTGLRKPRDFDGESIMKNIKRPIYLELSDSYFQIKSYILSLHNIGVSEIMPRQRIKGGIPKDKVAVIAGQWKLIKTFNPEQYELYDIVSDPKETKNLALKENSSLGKMKKILNNYLLKNGYMPQDLKPQKLDNNIEKLKSLGY